MDRQALTRVDIEISNNVWWDDNFQFGDPTDFTWTLNGLVFALSVKAHEEDAVPLLALTSVAGQIVVVDPVARILALAVPTATIRAALPEGRYMYDLLMQNMSTGQTDGMMYGMLEVNQGITTI